MSKCCIRCKREIAKSQSSCMVCGASQSYISHYKNTALFFLIALSLLALAGYKIFNAEGKLLEIERLRKVEIEEKLSRIKISQLEEDLKQESVKIQNLQSALALADTNASKNNLSKNESTLALKESDNRANEAKKRASWLNKENRRYKNEILKLTKKISDLEKNSDNLTSSENNTSKPTPVQTAQLPSLTDPLLNKDSEIKVPPSEKPPQNK